MNKEIMIRTKQMAVCPLMTYVQQ